MHASDLLSEDSLVSDKEGTGRVIFLAVAILAGYG